MKVIVSGIAGFIALVGLTALLDLFSEEIRGQLDRIPYAFLWLARRRVPEKLQTSLYDEEWKPELYYILNREEARPISRLILGSWFALGLLRTARRISRARDGSATTKIDEDEPFTVEIAAPVHSVLPDDWSVYEEADLVAQVVAGNAEGPLRELYRRYGARLYRFGVQLLGDQGLADEMVQETFVRIWRTAGRFDNKRGSFAVYLFVVARSISADIRKRPSSRPFIPLDDTELTGGNDDEPSDTQRSDIPWLATDTEDQRTQRLAIREAIESLPVSQQELIILAYYEGFTQAEIASRLSISPGTVKARMSCARRAVRNALLEQGINA